MLANASVANRHMPEQSPSKKSDFAYERIRQAIVEFQLFPGQFIDKVELCRALKVSRQPVTTALSRLEREGLVEILPQRGSYVARLSLSALMEPLFIRTALETFAVRGLAEAPVEAILVSLKHNMDEHIQAARNHDLANCSALDIEFHRIVCRSLGLPKVMEQVEIGFAAVSRCQHVLKNTSMLGEDGIVEHRGIVDAIAAREPHKAGELLVEHLRRFGRALEQEAKVRPDIFLP